MDLDMCFVSPNGIRALIIDNDNKFLKSVKMVLPVLNFEGTYMLAIMAFRPYHPAKMAPNISSYTKPFGRTPLKKLELEFETNPTKWGIIISIEGLQLIQCTLGSSSKR